VQRLRSDSRNQNRSKDDTSHISELVLKETLDELQAVGALRPTLRKHAAERLTDHLNPPNLMANAMSREPRNARLHDVRIT
jgi:hypothetical protein